VSEAPVNEFTRNKGMSPDDFHDSIPRIEEVAKYDLDLPEDLTDLTQRIRKESEGLLVDSSLLDECVAALISGNIVLQGPPGTGKSSISRALAKAFDAELLPVTAHEDWSTFEVIGRQELRVDKDGKESIVPVNGHFVEAVIRCAGRIPPHLDNRGSGKPGAPQATWLLIDELNRAHPDKAFGELFSVLGTDEPVDVTLAYQRPGNDRLVVPRRFRIIATINSIDKQFVNSLSQGLRRRFTFLTVDIPPKRRPEEPWGSNAADASMASREFTLVTDQAVVRVQRRVSTAEAELRSFVEAPETSPLLEAMFNLVERIRYADNDSPYPFIPMGTAPLIDTAELFLIHASQSGLKPESAALAMDWATSVKLVPLLDAGTVNRDKLHTLAHSLPSPLNERTKRAMLDIVSDGMFYIG
jgi:MoxR-like ATPase